MSIAHKRIAAVLVTAALLSGLGAAFVRRDANALGFSGDGGGIGWSEPDEDPDRPEPPDKEWPDNGEDAKEPTLGASGSFRVFGNAIEVDNETDFRAAVTGGLYETIYLTADIEMNTAGRIEITQPTTLTIDGGGHTINEMAIDRYINVKAAAQGSHITLKNVNVIGYDYYGIIGSRDVDVPNATLVFERVTYSGPQLTHWRGTGTGKTIIRDCDITIESRTGSHPANEVWEGGFVEFEGITQITHKSTTHPVFSAYRYADPRSAYENANRGYVLRAGALVTGTTSNTVFQTEERNRTALVLEEGAQFSLTSEGFMRSGDWVAYLDIGRAAGFQLLQTADRSTTAFNVDGTFLMRPDSVFRVEKQTALGVASYIYGAVTLDHPGLFLIKSGGTGMMTNGTRDWNVIGVNALNYTSTAGKSYYWNLPDDTLLPFGWTARGAAITPTQPIADIYGNDLNATNFNLTTTRVVATGNYGGPLTAHAAMQATAIAGSTAPGAYVQARFHPQGIGGNAAFTVEGAAGYDGSFSFPLPDGHNMATHYPERALHLRGYDWNGDLIADRVLPVVDAGEATLRITDRLEFGTQTIPGSRDELLSRTGAMVIRLEDTSMTPRNWRLMAREEQPLTGPTVIPGAFVYQTAQGQVALNAEDRLIADFFNPGGGTDWAQQLEYARNEGIVLGVAPGEALTGVYSGVITWTLVDA